MAQPAFDTHKAVKALCSAGFNADQAEAVVDQINGAVNENVATKADLDKLAIKEELWEAVAKLATKEELREAFDRLATKEELRETVAKLATKEELREAFDKLAAQQDKLAAQQDKLAAQQDKLAAQQDKLAAQQDKLAAQQDKLAAQQDKLAAQQDKFVTKEELREAIAKLELFVKAEIERHTNRSLKYVLAGAALFVTLTKALDFLVG